MRFSDDKASAFNGREPDENQHSVLVESEAILDKSNTFVGRAECVPKIAEELVVDTPPNAFPPSRLFDVGAASLGYIREVSRSGSASFGLRIMVTINVPGALRASYRSRTPVGALPSVRLRPVIHRGGMSAMPRMNG